ncbi:MAG: hypothetical protein ACJ8AW_13025 [Rhodopila sp.]
MHAHDESDLVLAERHVMEGQARIDRLKLLIERLEQTDNPEAAARTCATLAILSQTPALMQDHLDQIRRDVTGQTDDC